jgi:hypothetical protein
MSNAYKPFLSPSIPIGNPQRVPKPSRAPAPPGKARLRPRVSSNWEPSKGSQTLPRSGSAGQSPAPPTRQWARNRSASMAAMHPVPAAVTAWRYTWSATSPQANTPGTFVAVDPGWVSR